MRTSPAKSKVPSDKNLEDGRRFVHSVSPPGLQPADLSKVQKLLDNALANPIAAIEAIVREDLTREQWRASAESIKFEMLRKLANTVIERKESGENGTEFTRMRGELETLKKRLSQTESELKATQEELSAVKVREGQQKVELSKLKDDIRAINSACIEIGTNSISKRVRDQAEVLKGEELDDEGQYIVMFFRTLDSDMSIQAKKLAAMEVTNEELARENEHLKRGLNDSKAADQNKKRMEDLLKDLHVTVANLSSIRTDELVQSSERAMAFESRIRSLKEMTTSMNDKLTSLMIELGTTTTALDKSQSELRQTRDELETTSENLNRSTDILEKFQKKVGEMEDQMNITDVDDEEKSHVYLRSRLRRIIDEVGSLREDYIAQREQLKEKMRKLKIVKKKRLEIEGRYKKIEAYMVSIQNVLQVISSRSDMAQDRELVEVNALLKRMSDLLALQALEPEEEEESELELDDDELELSIARPSDSSMSRHLLSGGDDQDRTETSSFIQSPVKSGSEVVIRNEYDAKIESMQNEIAILNQKISELEEAAIDVLDEEGKPVTVPAKAIASGIKKSDAFSALQAELDRCRNAFGFRKLESAVSELERQVLKRTQKRTLDLDKRVEMLTQQLKEKKFGHTLTLPGNDISVEVLTGQFVSDIGKLEEEAKQIAVSVPEVQELAHGLQALGEKMSKHLVITAPESVNPLATPIKPSPSRKPPVSPLRLLDSPVSQRGDSIDSVIASLEQMTDGVAESATPTKRVENIIEKLENTASEDCISKLKKSLEELQKADDSKLPEIARQLRSVCTELEEARIAEALSVREDAMTPLLGQVSEAFSVIYSTLATLFQQPTKDPFIVTDSRSLCDVRNAFASLFIMIERYHSSVEDLVTSQNAGTYAQEIAKKLEELDSELKAQKEANERIQEESARKGQTLASLTNRMKKYQDGEKAVIQVLKPLVPDPSPSLLSVSDISKAVADLFEQITNTLVRVTGKSGNIFELLKALETQ